MVMDQPVSHHVGKTDILKLTLQWPTQVEISVLQVLMTLSHYRVVHCSAFEAEGRQLRQEPPITTNYWGRAS